MQSRLKLFRSFWHLGARINSNRYTTDVRYVSEGNNLLWNPFCTLTESVHVDESPELPHWIKSSSDEANPVGNSDGDDFVLSSLSSWIESHELHRPEVDLESQVGDLSDSEVDKISKILKNEFESPDAVVEALNGCSVDITEELIKQIFERFSFDWIRCLGFFKWAKSQRGSEFSPDLHNLGKSRKFDLMLDLVEEMKQLEGFITLVTMSQVMRRLTKAGKLDDAIDVFRNLGQYGLPRILCVEYFGRCID